MQYKDLRAFVIKTLKQKGKKLKLDVKSDFEEQKKNRIKRTKIEIENAENKKKRLIELYLEDQLITKTEFQAKRKEP